MLFITAYICLLSVSIALTIISNSELKKHSIHWQGKHDILYCVEEFTSYICFAIGLVFLTACVYANIIVTFIK